MAIGGCNRCAGRTKAERDFNPRQWTEVQRNDVAMVSLNGDAVGCEPYHGMFPGTHVFVVGQGTEHERLFLRRQRLEAVAYSTEHSVKISHLVNVRSLCHDRIVEFLGA